MENHITKVLMNKDGAYSQVDIDKAMKMQQFLPSIMAEQRKHKDEMEKQREISRSHLEGIKQQGKTSKEIRQMEIDAGRFDKSGGGISITDNLLSGKMKVPERLGTLKAILTSGINPDTSQPLSVIEKTYLQSMYDQDAATTEGKQA